jgi:hypothetical protein
VCKDFEALDFISKYYNGLFGESMEENNSMCSGFKLDTAEINVLV